MDEKTVSFKRHEYFPSKIYQEAIQGDFIFNTHGKEVIKICGDGSFYVNGKKTADDMKLYKAFVRFFKDLDYYR